jgi:hypothetical protein
MIKRNIVYRDGNGGLLMPMVIYSSGSIQGRTDTVLYQAYLTCPPNGIAQIEMSLVSYPTDYKWNVFETASAKEDSMFRRIMAAPTNFIDNIVRGVILEQTGFELVPQS